MSDWAQIVAAIFGALGVLGVAYFGMQARRSNAATERAVAPTPTNGDGVSHPRLYDLVDGVHRELAALKERVSDLYSWRDRWTLPTDLRDGPALAEAVHRIEAKVDRNHADGLLVRQEVAALKGEVADIKDTVTQHIAREDAQVPLAPAELARLIAQHLRQEG